MSKITQTGFVSIIGRPNVGKSTLLNKLLKTKLVAVSEKPQTTRHKILGILSEENYQIIFTDTPGIFTPKYTLQKYMVKNAIDALKEAEIILLLVEPFSIELEILQKINTPTILAINKVDLIKNKNELLPLIKKYSEFNVVREVHPISALKEIGIDELKKGIIKLLKTHEPYYPEDYLSDRSESFFVSEMIREKIYLLYGQEIPYASAIVIEEFAEREKGKYFIRAIIYVEKESERRIIIGEGGRAIKKLGIEARKEIEKFINHEVYLELWVKVRKDWRKDKHAIREFGYD